MANTEKVLQILYKIQHDSPCKDNTDIMYLLKILYFSDRYHLRHYGITASGDNYYAMERGPVASLAFDILRDSDIVNSLSEYAVEIPYQGNDELSESVNESVDFALRTFGKYNCWKLSDITHEYPEWKKHKKELKEGKNSRVQMDIKDFFDDPEDYNWLRKYKLSEDPFKEDKEFLQLLKEDL